MTGFSGKLEKVEQRIVELRAEIDSARVAFERKLAVLQADLDQQLEDAKAELIRCHETAAKLLRGEEGQELTNGEEPASKGENVRLYMPENATVREWAEQILRHSDPELEGMHFGKVADLAMHFGYGAPNCDKTIARTSFRRTMHKNDGIFQRIGEGIYRLRK